MTSQIFKQRVATIVLFCMAALTMNAQTMSMKELLDQSLGKVGQPTPEACLNCIAELKRIDAMFPDSIQPKYLTALQCLNFAVMNPHHEKTENALEEARQVISKMEG